MEGLIQDLRYASRQLRRAPWFALTAMLTLALGIGANTAMFSLLDQALLRSLPVSHPKELVVLRGTGDAWEGSSSDWGGGVDADFSYPMYRDLRTLDGAFQGMLATVPAQVNLRAADRARMLDVELVSGNYFDVLGVVPAGGRVLSQSDDAQPGSDPVAVMSYEYWRNEMGGDPAAIGSTVSLNGHPFQLVGVAPAGFSSAVWGRKPSLFVPLSMVGVVLPGAGSRLTDHQNRWLNLVARLKPGETAQQAQAQSAPLWHALRAAELQALGTRDAHFVDGFLTRSQLLVQPAAGGFSYNRDQLRQPLLAVMFMAVLVLLIAVVNVASLLLVRSAARVREFSMRLAVGATLRRLSTQLLMEGLLLGVGGGLLGLLFAPVLMHAVVSRLADNFGQAPFSTALDGRMLAFNFAVAVGVSLLFSLAPALQLRRNEVSSALRQSSSTSAHRVMLLRRLVVGTQVALSLLLLVAASLFLRTVQRLRAQDLGMQVDHLVTFGVTPALAGYTPQRLRALERQLLSGLASLPGVQHVAATTDPELAGNASFSNASFQQYTPPPGQKLTVEVAWISPEYFTTLGGSLIAGRAFTADDEEHHPAVAILNETLARQIFGSPQRALGQRMMRGESDHPQFDTEVVGIARNIQHQDMRTPVSPTVYRPLLQAPEDTSGAEIFFYVRSNVSTDEVLTAVRREVASVDPNLALDQVRSMDEQIATSMQNDRLIALLATWFGVLASVLAGIGLYGVLAFVTAQRTREIGVRMALGATRWHVSQLVLGDVLKTALGGLTVGLVAALGLGQFVHSLLYGVSATDPFSLLAAVLCMLGIAVAAAALPMQRAASVRPTEALRTE